MGAQTKPRKAPPHPVDRALTRARAAVGELIRLLCDEDRATVEQAAAAMTEIGPFCVGPLAAALPRAGVPRDRLVLVGALMTFGPRAKAVVAGALTRALRREQDPHVRAGIRAALTRLMLDELRQDPVPNPGR